MSQLVWEHKWTHWIHDVCMGCPPYSFLRIMDALFALDTRKIHTQSWLYKHLSTHRSITLDRFIGWCYYFDDVTQVDMATSTDPRLVNHRLLVIDHKSITTLQNKLVFVLTEINQTNQSNQQDSLSHTFAVTWKCYSYARGPYRIDKVDMDRETTWLV